jgi:hypothetical protein
LNKKTTRIGKADDIARHLGRNHLETDPETGKVIGVFNTAFDLKVAKKEKEASVNHLQFFSGETLNQLKSIKADMVNSGYTVGPQSAYSVVRVETVESCGKDSGVSLAVFKRPLEKNRSHAGLRGLPLDNSNAELRERLAQAASRVIFAAAEL